LAHPCSVPCQRHGKGAGRAPPLQLAPAVSFLHPACSEVGRGIRRARLAVRFSRTSPSRPAWPEAERRIRPRRPRSPLQRAPPCTLLQQGWGQSLQASSRLQPGFSNRLQPQNTQ
jgi:hypothetical protein